MNVLHLLTFAWYGKCQHELCCWKKMAVDSHSTLLTALLYTIFKLSLGIIMGHI